MNNRDHQILKIALPAIVTNITVPLLGMVDTAIVGHMGAAAYIGAIAVGSMMFNLVYWLFGFLRMGTSGMTAQARGRRDMTEAADILAHSVAEVVTVAVLMLLMQWPLYRLLVWLIAPTDDVVPWVDVYFRIVVWGAPAVLGLYSLTGWFIGMQNTRIPMVVSILQNVVNIAASLLFVYGWGMQVEGVALGTVVAQYAGVVVALAFLWRYYRKVLAGRIVGSVLMIQFSKKMVSRRTDPMIHNSRDCLPCVEIIILIMAVIEGKFNCSSALCTCAVVPPKRYAQPRDSARGR